MIGPLLRWRKPRTAAQWFAARLGKTDPKLERQFHAWLLEDSTHGEEYALCEIAWEVSHDAAKEAPEPKQPRIGDRTVLPRRAAAFAIAAAAAALVIWFWPPSTLAYSTASGEQRTLLLQDGSRVTLNTRTRLTVRLARHEREIDLQQGEAFFEIAKDPSRPFTVHTSLGSARAVGTRFNVYLGTDHLSVTTEQGTVLVESPLPGSGVLVGAGSRAELRAGTPRAVLESVDLSAALGTADSTPGGRTTRPWKTCCGSSAATPIYLCEPTLRPSARCACRRFCAQATWRRFSADFAGGAFGLEIERRGEELVVIDPTGSGTRSPASQNAAK